MCCKDIYSNICFVHKADDVSVLTVHIIIEAKYLDNLHFLE